MPEKAEVIFLRGGESRSDPAAVRHDPTQSASDPTVADLPVDKGRRNETRGSDASNAVTTALCEQAPRSIGISYTPFVRGILPFYKTFIQADQGEYHSGILPIRALEVTPGFEPGNEGFADPCLTTWLCHRTVKSEGHYTIAKGTCQGGILFFSYSFV